VLAAPFAGLALPLLFVVVAPVWLVPDPVAVDELAVDPLAPLKPPLLFADVPVRLLTAGVVPAVVVDPLPEGVAVPPALLPLVAEPPPEDAPAPPEPALPLPPPPPAAHALVERQSTSAVVITHGVRFIINIPDRAIGGISMD
jgi:hypothetical protein